MIKLPETRRKFPAVGSRGVYDNQRTRRFDVRIFAVAFVGHNRIDVGGITFREPVHINLNAARFQLVFVRNRRRLLLKLCDNDAVDLDFH